MEQNRTWIYCRVDYSGTNSAELLYMQRRCLESYARLIFKLCKCRKMSQPQCHYTKYFVAVKTKMHVEDSLDSNKIFDFW